MKAKRLLQATPKTFALVFDAGDTVMDELHAFASAEGLSAASLTGIGAFSEARLGFFNPEQREYEEIVVGEQAEVLSLVGDVALTEDGEPQVHAHVVLGGRDGGARGGHLLEATVRPTLEVVLTESPPELRRRSDPASGLALIDLDR